MTVSFNLFVSRADAQAPSSTNVTSPLDDVVHTLCDKRVVLLGENPTHSFANTLEFKVQIVHRLIDECQFNSLYFEAGIYDFIHLEQVRSSGERVTDSLISAAIGGLWANRETQALVPFLTERVNAGRLMLAGLDDQIGAGTWASSEMANDLVQPLQAEEKIRCTAAFRKHLLWQYTDEAPYGPADKKNLLDCLDESQMKLASRREKTGTAEQSRVMVESLQRDLARNFTEDDFTKEDQVLKWMNDRDRSMYLNYTWLGGRLPAHSKIIVWAATVHTAKDLPGIAGFEGRIPLGSYIHREEKGKAFSLGFSAYSGEYAFTHRPVKHLSDAPASSLEARVFAHIDSNTVYLSSQQLREYGSCAARVLGIGFNTAPWDQILDGLIVFRQERAPTWIKRAVQ